jgi:flagellin-like protein
MGLFVTSVFALSLWVVLIAFGVNPLDGLLLALVIIVTAAGVRVLGQRFSGEDS